VKGRARTELRTDPKEFGEPDLRTDSRQQTLKDAWKYGIWKPILGYDRSNQTLF